MIAARRAALAAALAAHGFACAPAAVQSISGNPMDTTFDRSVPPTPGPLPALELPPIQRQKLSNGLEVLIVEQHELPVVDLRLVVRAGAAADHPDLAGRASLTGEMLDEGTAAYGALELADAIDRLGANLETSVSWDATTISLHVLRPRLEPALDLLAEVVVRPTFPEDEFERVRAERLADLVRQLQEPRILALQAFSAEVYGPEHPYAALTSGTRETIERLDRDSLTAFYREHFHPGNAFLVAVGDVEPETLLPLLERALGDWAPAARKAARTPGPPAPRPTTIVLVDKPGAAQSEIRIGHAAAPRSTPDYFPLLVMNTILGGSFTSRLNMALREERGYTYGAGSRFEFRLGPGPFVASSAVFTGVTDSAVAVFLEEIRRIREEPVSGEELRRAKNYVALGLPRRLETTDGIARSVAEVELYGLADDYYERFVDRVQAVTVEDVARVARKYLHPEQMVVVVVGDRAQVEEPLRRLGVAPVVVKGGGT